MVTIVVNERRIEAAEGTSLLKACLDNGYYIPNLCHVEGGGSAAASCRLCFVAVEGEDQPVASCCVAVRDGMRIRTDTPVVRHLQTSAFKLLLSVHDVDCKNCPANRRCALQDIARHLKVGLTPKPFSRRLKEPAVDTSHPCIDYYPNRCVLCGRCIEACRRASDRPELTFIKRGFDTVIGFFGHTDGGYQDCSRCRSCVDSCPVSALALKAAEAP